MKTCPSCGYERQQKDEGIIPATECPKCGIIYEKAINSPVHKGIYAHHDKMIPEKESSQNEVSKGGATDGRTRNILQSCLAYIGEMGIKNFTIVATLMVIVLMCIYPPWAVNTTRGNYHVGYALVFLPPTERASVDLIRLIVQCAVVVTIATLVIYMVDITDQKKRRRESGDNDIR